MVDTTNLTEKLNSLTGNDFEQVEREERLAGNSSVDVAFSKSFQARLAARALGVNPYDIKELPLNQYTRITMSVFNFLFGNLAADETPSTTSETLPQTSKSGEA